MRMGSIDSSERGASHGSDTPATTEGRTIVAGEREREDSHKKVSHARGDHIDISTYTRTLAYEERNMPRGVVLLVPTGTGTPLRFVQPHARSAK